MLTPINKTSLSILKQRVYQAGQSQYTLIDGIWAFFIQTRAQIELVLPSTFLKTGSIMQRQQPLILVSLLMISIEFGLDPDLPPTISKCQLAIFVMFKFILGLSSIRFKTSVLFLKVRLFHLSCKLPQSSGYRQSRL